MKKSGKNQFSSAILDAIVQKIENNYLEKIQILSNSKSVKSIPSVNNRDNAFKNQTNKFQQIGSKSTKHKKQTQKIIKNKQRTHNNWDRIDGQTNKFISSAYFNGKNNPQQFFVRNHLYQKQKELKLQFQRRKKLYGITSDVKLKSDFVVKQIQEIQTQEIFKQSQQKSYKDLYQQKYGKFKIYDKSIGKKKVKNYEQLMKESIARFQQKFKQLGTNHSITYKYIQRIQDYESKQIRQTNKQSMITELQKQQRASLIKSLKNEQSLQQVNQKIKILMEKLHIQEEFNASVQSITDLSKLQLQQSFKHPQLDSSIFQNSNSFNNQAQFQNAIFEEQTHIFPHLNETVTKQQTKNIFTSSFPCIIRNGSDPISRNVHEQQTTNDIQNIRKSIKETFQQCEEIRINALNNLRQQKQQISQEIQIQKYEEHMNTKFSVKKQMNQYEQIVKKKQQGQITNQIVEDQQNNQDNKAIQLLKIDEERRGKDDKECLNIFESVHILTQKNNYQCLNSFTFKEINHPKNNNLIQDVSKKIHIKSHAKNQVGFVKEKTQQQSQYHISNQAQNKQKTYQKQTKKTKEQAQPIYLQVQSQQYKKQTQIQSFVDLSGNFLENVQVQVQIFGYCRFLAIQQQSERFSQDSYS